MIRHDGISDITKSTCTKRSRNYTPFRNTRVFPRFSVQFLLLNRGLVHNYLPFWPYYVGHCIVCPSMCGFWLPFRYLQLFFQVSIWYNFPSNLSSEVAWKTWILLDLLLLIMKLVTFQKICHQMMPVSLVCPFLIFPPVCHTVQFQRRVWRYQRGNQNKHNWISEKDSCLFDLHSVMPSKYISIAFLEFKVTCASFYICNITTAGC